MVSNAQVRLLRRKLMEGKRQEGAAAAAGISARSARRCKKVHIHLNEESHTRGAPVRIHSFKYLTPR